MTNDEILLEAHTRLRRLAEERVEKWAPIEIDGHTDLLQVIYELKIHLAEQEIINEELVLTIDNSFEK